MCVGYDTHRFDFMSGTLGSVNLLWTELPVWRKSSGCHEDRSVEFFVGLCWSYSSVSINLHPPTVEELSVDLFIREQHRPSLSTVICWGVDQNTCILRRPSVKFLFGCTMLHITPCLCTYIILYSFYSSLNYRDRFVVLFGSHLQWLLLHVFVKEIPPSSAGVCCGVTWMWVWSSLAHCRCRCFHVRFGLCRQLRKIEATLCQNLSGSIRSPWIHIRLSDSYRRCSEIMWAQNPIAQECNL